MAKRVSLLSMKRVLPVCVTCWDVYTPSRPAKPDVGQGEKHECIICEKPTTAGLFVRMQVEWI